MKQPLFHIATLSCQLHGIYGITPDQELRDYLRLFERTKSFQGERETVKYLKDLYTQSVAIATDRQVTPIPFRKSNKKGIDRNLRPFLHLLTGPSENHRRLGLTVLRLCYLAYGDPQPNLQSIVGQAEKDWSEQQYQGFRDFAHHWVKPLDPEGEIKVIPRAKSGPNGSSSLTSSHLDAVALTNNPQLLQSLDSLAEIIHPNYGLKTWVEEVSHWSKENFPSESTNVYVSRLAALAEGGYKTRIIAIGDLFSQAVLLPLHKKIMGRLALMRNDGTFDQGRSISLVKEWTTQGPLYSFDLTNATDRFPVRLQEIVMTQLFGERVSQLWKEVMSNRDFSLSTKPNSKTVRYSRGQGMGLYTSWPAFAFTHHVFVRYCAFLEGITPFDKYTIIGDDVVIADKRVADRYLKELVELEVPISSSKSFFSDSPPYSGEICKRILWNGKDISPVPPQLLKQIGKDVTILPALLKEIVDRYGSDFFRSGSPCLTSLANCYSTANKRRKALILLTAPQACAHIGLQDPYGNTDQLRDQVITHELLGPWGELESEILTDFGLVRDQLKLLTITREYDSKLGDLSYYTENPLVLLRADKTLCLATPESRHPFWEGYRHHKEILDELAKARVASFAATDAFLEENGLRFCLDPKLRSYQERKIVQGKRASHLILDVFKVLSGKLPYPEMQTTWATTYDSLLIEAAKASMGRN
jgi:hypothetical protein